MVGDGVMASHRTLGEGRKRGSGSKRRGGAGVRDDGPPSDEDTYEKMGTTERELGGGKRECEKGVASRSNQHDTTMTHKCTGNVDDLTCVMLCT